MNKAQRAEQLRKVLQLFAASLDEDSALTVATVYPEWAEGKSYAAGEYVTYGENNVGDPQLYKVLQPHTSQPDWTPDITPALYAAIGLDGGGYPVWSRPTGAADAYNKGDIVDYDGTLYRSTIDGNVWSPSEYPAGWEAYTEEE